jgi:hypothetical protein
MKTSIEMVLEQFKGVIYWHDKLISAVTGSTTKAGNQYTGMVRGKQKVDCNVHNRMLSKWYQS